MTVHAEPLLREWHQRNTPAVLGVMEGETEAGQEGQHHVEGLHTWNLPLPLSWPALQGQHFVGRQEEGGGMTTFISGSLRPMQLLAQIFT